MKPFHYIVFLLLTCIFIQNSPAQTTQRRTPRQQREAQESSVTSLSTRAEAKNKEQAKNLDNMVWLREIYRYVDLNKENNAALYYPEQPIGDRMNLFSMIFKLMGQGKIQAYKYMDGREIFTDQYKINFEEDVLKLYQVLYTTQGTGNNTQYIFNDSDIPSNEVTMYMIKEAWYFDQATGTFNSRILAICPMLIRQEDEYGQPSRSAMFWLRYEDIRPYVSRAFIMTSNINNALTYTIDDFFSKRMYTGEIIKTTNMMNKSLAQQVGNDPAVLKLAQDSIENQLKFFEKELWVKEDTTKTTDKKGDAQSKKSSEKKQKEDKPKEAKPEKPTTTKSVRRTR